MLRRLLSILLVFVLLCIELPAALNSPAFAEVFDSDDEVIEDGTAVSEGDMYDETEDTENSDYTELKRGDRDAVDSTSVLTLQNRLRALDYITDAPDGVYGGDTEEAVSEFQRLNGLKVTGIADAATQELLFSDKELVRAPLDMNSENVVYRVQEKLAQWGFLVGTPDGRNGQQTKKAIKLFNTYLEDYLKVYPTPAPEPSATPDPSGITGFADALIAEDMLLPSFDTDEINENMMAFVDGTYDFEVYRQTVKNGDSGDEVLRVQRRLKQLTYLYSVDGSFGASTERALLYFQKKNGLDQSGIADQRTQQMLFSENALESEEFINPYKLVVDVSEQRTYVYQWDGTSYGICLGKSKCSTGKKGKATETPLGTYQAIGPSGTGEWYYFQEFKCYAKWGFHIVGGIMFHSVTYNSKKRLNEGSVSYLGRRASHGCIRLPVKAAKWIYDNCPAGTTVVIQN